MYYFFIILQLVTADMSSPIQMFGNKTPFSDRQQCMDVSDDMSKSFMSRFNSENKQYRYATGCLTVEEAQNVQQLIEETNKSDKSNSKI